MNATALRALAPTGVLRVAVNLGNTVLVQRAPQGDALQGVSIELAGRLAQEFGLPLQWSVHDSAGQAFGALRDGLCDLGFLAIDPERAGSLAFTSPYLHIEGAFMVPADSEVQAPDQLDRPHRRIAVNAGSAYGLHLARHLRHARLETSPTAREAFDRFVDEGMDAAAGVRSVLERYVSERPALRVLAEPFMRIEQAMAVRRDSAEAMALLLPFIERAKADGLVAAALARSSQNDATVAPPCPT